jgi:hypothetical protein
MVTRSSRSAGRGPVLVTDRSTLTEVSPEIAAAILEDRTVDGVLWADGYPFDGTIGGVTLVTRMLENGS